MSGGSFNYLYSRIDELDAFVGALGNMAQRCRDWAEEEEAEDAAIALSLLRKAQRLEILETMLRAIATSIQKERDLLHDVEWCASGDITNETLARRP